MILVSRVTIFRWLLYNYGDLFGNYCPRTQHFAHVLIMFLRILLYREVGEFFGHKANPLLAKLE